MVRCSIHFRVRPALPGSVLCSQCTVVPSGAMTTYLRNLGLLTGGPNFRERLAPMRLRPQPYVAAIMALLRERTHPELEFIEPCLPSPVNAPPSGPGWIHEIKHDGFRILARRDTTGVRLITRNAKAVSTAAGPY
jgi:hypothetical protein